MKRYVKTLFPPVRFGLNGTLGAFLGGSYPKVRTVGVFIRWELFAFLVGWVALTTGGFGQPVPLDLGFESEGHLKIDAEFTVPQGDKSSFLVIRARIRPGHYIYSLTQPPGGPRPTRIRLKEASEFRLAGEFRASPPPQTKQDPLFNNLQVEFHSGEVTWFAPIAWQPGVNLSQAEIIGSVQVQVCDETTCYPPQDYSFRARLGEGALMPSLEEEVSPVLMPDAQTTAPDQRPSQEIALTVWIAILLGAFAGGLILNLMPCVLPVISLKLFALIQQAGESRRRILMLNLWFVLGLMSVFMVLATLSAAFNLAWGEQFTYTWFKVALIALVFALALSFLGVWELPIPGFAGSVGVGQLQMREGAVGAFFKGVFTTILATPCTGPFLGAVFGFTLDKPPHVSYLIFGTVGLGMAFPYVIVGIFPQLIRVLPKPGAWMNTLKEIMGFFLLGTVVYMFSTINSDYFIPTLAFVVGLWLACWLVGKVPLTVGRLGRTMTWIAALGITAASGGFAYTVLVPGQKIPWEPFTPERLEAALREGRTVMVEFTADWCPNCKWNMATAIETNRVARLIAENNVLPLLADWTDESPMIKNFLTERLRRRSIPVLAIYPAGGTEQDVIILDGILVESQVIEALRRAGPSLTRGG